MDESSQLLPDLVNRTLSNSLQLADLRRHHKVKVFLDSFNEIPREYVESGSYEADLSKFISGSGDASIVIGSRTNDGLLSTGFPSYSLDQIDDRFVTAELQRLGIEVRGRFEREVRYFLQKPFYFQLVANGTVSLPEDAHPRDFYQIFFQRLTLSFKERFGQPFDLEEALSIAAYEAINQGEEAQSLSDVLETLKAQLEAAGYGTIAPADVANWLVSKSVIIPYRGARIAFFHQSVTEYLAARELARLYCVNPTILREKLSLTRWDQALFLTLSLLSPNHGESFLNTVVDTDFALALRATKYLEFDRDRLVSILLSQIPSRIEGNPFFDGKIESALQFGVALSDVHEPQLRDLIKLRNLIGAAAVIRLVELRGTSVKDELLQTLVEARDDYNYCVNGVARALRSLAIPDDIQKVLRLADSIGDEVTPTSDDDVAGGFMTGAADFLSELDLMRIREGFLPKDSSEALPEIRARLLCDLLRNRRSADALELAGELLVRGVNKAATAIYFVAHFGNLSDSLSWSSFSQQHVELLVSSLYDKNNDAWTAKALKCLCEARADLAEVVRSRSVIAYGAAKVVLTYCASSAHPELIFDALTEYASMSPEERKGQVENRLEEIELDWAGHEALFLQLLRLRDAQLAVALLTKERFETSVGELDIGSIEWWLQWLTDEIGVDRKTGNWLAHCMGELFSHVLNTDARHAFVAELNNKESRFRRVLIDFILPGFPEVTTDIFSDDAVSFLLADLTRAGATRWSGKHLLGSAATERFVTERLLPLLADAQPPFLDNIRNVLKQAGSRHGRRYIRT